MCWVRGLPLEASGCSSRCVSGSWMPVARDTRHHNTACNTCHRPCALRAQTPAVVKARVDPLVFQTYKTTAVFLSSWLVLTYNEFQWTAWGMVGSLVWVPAGVGAVLAVRCAGLGISQGVWSGLSGKRAACMRGRGRRVRDVAAVLALTALRLWVWVVALCSPHLVLVGYRGVW